jgi:hypothetical protein
MGRATSGAEAGPPDAEAVASGVALVDQVLQLAGIAHGGWKEHDGTGRKAILTTCPFNPPGDPHEADEAAFVVVGADGRLGVIHRLRGVAQTSSVQTRGASASTAYERAVARSRSAGCVVM